MKVEGPIDWDSSTAGGIPGVGGSASFLVMAARKNIRVAKLQISVGW